MAKPDFAGRGCVLGWMGYLAASLTLCGATAGAQQAGSAMELPPKIQALLPKAKAEGEMVVYSSTGDEINAELKEGYEKLFGVRMSYLRLTSGPQAEKIRQELAANAVQVDSFLISDGNFVQDLIAKDQLLSITDLPVPDGFPKSAPYLTTHCVQSQQFAHSIGFNTRKVPAAQAPKGWVDLLDPRWKGQIGIMSPRVGTGIQTWWYTMRQEFGEDFFVRLAAQNVRMYEDVGSIHNDLASGAIAIQIPAWPYGMQSIAVAGAPVKSVYPSPTSGVEDLDCVLKGARHPNAGLLFVWYTMTRAGQTALNGRFRGNSPMPGIENSDPLPPNTRFNLPSDLRAARNDLFSLADRTAAGHK
jgi:iron(III) transport system substrate-binding protein